jgi:hypothetical protein
MKIIDFLIGLAVLFMGLLPFLRNIESIAARVAFIGEPCGIVYQVILIILGVLVILYSLKKEKK